MDSGGFRFQRFFLDTRERQLLLDDVPVEMNSRYFDALVLLVREQGKLVSKDRFFEEVWRGVPVTDEALTQCIKTLRRQLGDSAASPCFIETVPKHGYRFIAPVEWVGHEAAPPAQAAVPASSTAIAPRPYSWQQFLLLGGAGMTGAGVSGIIGGLFYGFVGASHPLQPGMGAVSVLLVLTCLTILMALVGGAGVSFGIAAAGFASSRLWQWSVAGGAAGGWSWGPS
ncbi:winged helix-turn-helix domain-containing protein [Indioceanicola profundi]|uniref:winged helix-turn-helix domain-containing protein n=1 Tax=Indioceanicola profundi TaxID=2220096 RepID=UPI000E6AAD95|nr:transcriptional regulator [Indioceanicola profundi]